MVMLQAAASVLNRWQIMGPARKVIPKAAVSPVEKALTALFSISSMRFMEKVVNGTVNF